MIVKEIPEDRYICKFCYQCSCSEDAIGKAYCQADIHDLVDVDSHACCDFEYDDTFKRT